MRCDLRQSLHQPPPIPSGYRMVKFRRGLVADHAEVKYRAFSDGLDAFVFHCLAKRDGCLRLMREIVARDKFCAQATWLTYHDDPNAASPRAVGTVQGLILGDIGSIQNLGIDPLHRGRRLGTSLLYHAAAGFRGHGINAMQLEVTSDNVDAVRLYEKIGFAVEEVVYKAAEIHDAGVG